MRRKIMFPLLVVTLLLTGLAGPVAAGEPAPDRASQQFEIRFMEKTIEHHLMGVEMGEMCVEEAPDPLVAGDQMLIELCAQIVAAQSAQAEMLMGWLLEWYGIEFEPKLPRGAMNRLERASGEEFDVLVSEMFIDHHSQQIRMSDDCLLRAWHGDLRTLCQQMIATQASEILVFRQILEAHGEE